MTKELYCKSLIAACAITSAVTTQAVETKPNVLFILIDDFGWKDLGYNGSTFYETPCMDQLAKEWMKFDNCYTPSPMCSPTRLSILTGKNPARHGVTQWLPGRDRFYGRKGEEQKVYCPKPLQPGIKDSDITLGEAFQEAGYDTAFYGKWHMGSLKQTGGALKHGYATQKAVIESNKCRMFFPFRGDYFPDAKKGDNFSEKLTDAAIEFVTQKRNEPFYFHLCHFAMHAPIETSPELRQKFEEKKKRMGIVKETALDNYSHQPHKLRQDSAEYAGELYTLDKNIGRLIDALKKSGQYDNTIIILTGDNGGRATTNKPYATSIAPLRGGKTFLFEGGLRTPLLIHWPGQSQGKVSDTPVTSMDFYPTLLDMTGLDQKPNQHLDGVSLVPLFKDNTVERDTFYWHFPHYQGEGSYPASAIRVGDYKLIYNYHHGNVLLFDLKNDPNETKNQAASMPEKAKELTKNLLSYLEETGAYMPSSAKK